MFIKQLQLEGYRNIINKITLDFESGVSMIYGKSRSGKSSVLKFIRLILLNITDKALKDYVNENMDFFEGSLEFEHDGINYLTTIMYDLKTEKTTRTLYIEDFSKPELSGTTEVVKKLEEIFDVNLTKNALAVMKNSSQIISSKPSERLELFKKIKNIDFSKDVKDFDTLAKSLEDQDLKEVESDIKSLENKTYKTITIQKEPFTIKEIEEKREKVKTIDEDLLSIQSKKEQIEEKNKEKNKTASKIENDETSLTTNKVQLKETKSKEFVSKLEDYKKEINSLESEIKDYPLEAPINTNTLNDKRNKIQKDKIEKEKTLEDPKYKLSRIRKPVDIRDELKAKITTLKAEIKHEENTIFVCQSGQCPTCRKDFEISDIEDHQSIIEGYEKQKEVIEEELKVENRKFEDYEDKVEKQNKLKEEKTELETNIQKFEDYISRVEKDIDNEIEKQTKKWEDDLVNLKSSLSSKKELLTLEEKREKEFLDNKKTQIETLENSIKTLEESINTNNSLIINLDKEINSLELSIDESHINSLENSKKDLEKDITTYNEVITENNQARKHNEEIEQEKLDDTNKLNELVENKDTLLNNIKDLKACKKILSKDFPNFVIQETIKDTEDMMNKFIEEVFENPMSVSLRSTATSLVLEYGNNEKRKRDCLNASDSESMMTTVAFVHSLNEQIGLGIIFLDEVDSPLDEASVKELYNVIGKMKYKQILIISHNSYMKDKLLEDGAKLFNMEEIIND